MNSNPVKYAVVIEKAGSNDSAYAPDLPGVIATGSTPEATERNMREAIALHLRELRAAGEPVPAPTTKATYVANRGRERSQSPRTVEHPLPPIAIQVRPQGQT